MSATREAERRRWYLERFLEATDSGRVEEGDSAGGSATDFRVTSGGAPVGVRVVEILGPSTESGLRKSVRAFRAAVMDSAERKWTGGGGHLPVEVWVEFSAHEQTTSARARKDLARRLCELAESGLPEVGGFARLLAGRNDAEGSYPLVAPALTVARLPTYTGSAWHAVSGSTPGTLDEDAVRRGLERAGDPDSGKLAEVDERWLVEVVESFRHPSGGGLPDDLPEGASDSGFDRLWLYDPVADEARELDA